MAQTSRFWATNGTGDGQALSQEDWRELWHALAARKTADAAILQGIGQELAVTDGAGGVNVGTGRAIVYGFYYKNTASVAVAIPTPSSGTTGHRVVLRADFAAQTVRVALKSSADGTAAIPALTQTDGATWEVPLASVTITTAGARTITDQREFLVGAAGAPHGLQLDVRHGGDASDWSVVGATVYALAALAAVQLEAGRVALAGSGGASDTVTVTFDTPFAAAPLLICSFTTTFPDGKAVQLNYAATASDVDFVISHPDATAINSDVEISWLAIGPKA